MSHDPKKFRPALAMFVRLPYCVECGRAMKDRRVGMTNAAGKWMHQSCHKRLVPAKKRRAAK